MTNPSPSSVAAASLLHRVRSAPSEHPAVVRGTETIQRDSLLAEAHVMGQHLSALGRRGVVAIATRDRLGVLEAVLGALTAQWVWVALDLDQPDARLRRMLRSVRPDAVIGDDAELLRVAQLDTNGQSGRSPSTTSVGRLWSAHAEVVDEDRWERAALLGPADDVGYLSFTSGTTGGPKAVVGSLQGLHDFVSWEVDHLCVRPGWRFSQLTSPSFDAWLRDVFVPLAAGGTVCLQPTAHPLVGQELAAWLDATDVHVLHCVPAQLRSLSPFVEEDRWPSLACIAVAGDRLHGTDVARWVPLLSRGVRMLNLYGATETTMVKLCHEVVPDDAHARGVPVGAPIAGARAYIVDDHGEPAGVGTVGEIAIAPAHRPLGYLAHDATGGRFVDGTLDGANAVLYLTGDLGSQREDGELVCLGRLDGQVKVRGVRVDLAELDETITSHGDVEQVASVTCRDAEGEHEVVTFVVGGSIDRLSAICREELPRELRPAAIVRLDALPLTSRGKVDRGALRQAAERHRSASTASPSDAADDDVCAVLHAVWCEQIGTDHIDLDESYFDIGGNSLAAIRLCARMSERLGVEVPLGTFFEGPSIRQLAAALGAASSSAARAGVVRMGPDRIDLPRLWCVHPAGGTVAAYAGLAQDLAPIAAVYGLQAAGLDGAEPPDTSVEQMAARHVCAIRSVQAEGPYHLLGWSGGGVVVLEIARQLADAGESLGWLCLLDAAAPGEFDEPDDDLSILADALSSLDSTTIEEWRHELGGMSSTEQLDAARVRLGRDFGVVALDASDVERYIDVYRAHVNARRTYRGGPVAARFALVQPSVEPVRSAGRSLVAWKTLASLGVDVHTVPGPHRSMLERPALDALVALATNALTPRQVRSAERVPAPLAPSVIELVGSTPLVELQRLFADLPLRVLAKLEGFNPGGSSKDRSALHMIRHAIERGDVTPGRTVVVESTSGNMGIGLAQVCAYYGVDLICVVDGRATNQNLAIMRAYGAQVHVIDRLDPDTNDYLTARLRRVVELVDGLRDGFWPNQYANTDNSDAHRTTMREIHRAAGEIDYLFCATSTCGTIRGCAEYIAEQGLQTQVFGVDAVGSVVLGGPVGERLIPGHGAVVVPELSLDVEMHHVVKVTDLDCIVGCRALLSREALLAGGSSGAVVSAIRSVAPELRPGSICVAILPDRGERYLDTVFDDAWVHAHFPHLRSDHEGLAF